MWSVEERTSTRRSSSAAGRLEVGEQLLEHLRVDRVARRRAVEPEQRDAVAVDLVGGQRVVHRHSSFSSSVSAGNLVDQPLGLVGRGGDQRRRPRRGPRRSGRARAGRRSRGRSSRAGRRRSGRAGSRGCRARARGSSVRCGRRRRRRAWSGPRRRAGRSRRGARSRGRAARRRSRAPGRRRCRTRS